LLDLRLPKACCSRFVIDQNLHRLARTLSQIAKHFLHAEIELQVDVTSSQPPIRRSAVLRPKKRAGTNRQAEDRS
jgi:hypothetical protein